MLWGWEVKRGGTRGRGAQRRGRQRRKNKGDRERGKAGMRPRERRTHP